MKVCFLSPEVGKIADAKGRPDQYIHQHEAEKLKKLRAEVRFLPVARTNVQSLLTKLGNYSSRPRRQKSYVTSSHRLLGGGASYISIYFSSAGGARAEGRRQEVNSTISSSLPPVLSC